MRHGRFLLLVTHTQDGQEVSHSAAQVMAISRVGAVRVEVRAAR
jgi:hypothetical protein